MRTYILRYNNLPPEALQATFILISITLSLCGIYCIIYYLKNRNKKTPYNSKNALLLGIYLFLWGISSVPAAIKWNKTLYLLIFILYCGIFLIISGILQLIYLKKCTEKISARFYYSEYVQRSSNKIPTFKYKYNGEEYNVRSLQAIPSKDLAHLKYNTNCEIYINPDDPMMNIYIPKVNKMHAKPFILGVILILLAILLYFIPVI